MFAHFTRKKQKDTLLVKPQNLFLSHQNEVEVSGLSGLIHWNSKLNRSQSLLQWENIYPQNSPFNNVPIWWANCGLFTESVWQNPDKCSDENVIARKGEFVSLSDSILEKQEIKLKRLNIS